MHLMKAGCRGPAIRFTGALGNNQIIKVGEDLEGEGGLGLGGIAVDMKGGSRGVPDKEFFGLEVDNACLLVAQGRLLQRIKAAYLPESLQQQGESALGRYYHYIEQPIGKGRAGRNGKVVAKLVAVGHRNKVGIGSKFLTTCRKGKWVGPGREEV